MARELYGEFLKKRNAWYKEKNRYYDECKTKNNLDEYARWLSSEGLVREDEVNNYYNDTIVRGNYHEVLTLLGFLNVSSPSEVLESTKQKMRGSLRRSLDGSTDVYPVQFQPSNWFRTLRPNMSPKDLTMATDSLIAEYRSKQARLRNLQAQRSELTVVEISPEKREALEREIKDKETALSEAEQNLVTMYGSGALSTVKAVVNIYKEFGDPIARASQVMQDVQGIQGGSLSPEQNRIYQMIEGVSAEAIKSITDTMNAQVETNKQLQKLTDARMAFTETKVKDMRLQRLRIEEQIANVQADLDFLSPLVSGTVAVAVDATGAATAGAGAGSAGASKPEPDPELMTGAEEGVEDSGFTDIIIKSADIASSSSDSSSSSASQSSWALGGLFWSAGGQSSSAAASSAQAKTTFQKKVEIGLRVKKITFDRGGWFNPNVFKLSNNYYRLAEIRFSKGITKDEVKKCMEDKNPSTALKRLVTYTSSEGDARTKELSYTLPAFPTGFVIAKDITVRIEADSTESESSRKYMEGSHSSGGGILGFKTSASGSSKSQSEAAYFGSTANYFYIRIPGPQIIGWFLEFTPADNTNPYQQLDPSMYANEIKSLINEISEAETRQPRTEGV
jgi:hypothetical protein